MAPSLTEEPAVEELSLARWRGSTLLPCLQVIELNWTQPLRSNLLQQGDEVKAPGNDAFMKAYSAAMECGDDEKDCSQLYSYFALAVEDVLQKAFKAHAGEGEALLLFQDVWKAFTFFTYELWRVFQYLDRFFTVSGGFKPLVSKAVDLFRDIVFNPMQEKLVDELSRIEASEGGCCGLLASVADSLDVMCGEAPQIRRDAKAARGCRLTWHPPSSAGASKADPRELSRRIEQLSRTSKEEVESSSTTRPSCTVDDDSSTLDAASKQDSEFDWLGFVGPFVAKRARKESGGDVKNMIRSKVAVRAADGSIQTAPRERRQPPRPASAVYPLHTLDAPGCFQAGKQLVEAIPEAPRPLCPVVHVGCVTPCPTEELEPLLEWLRTATTLPEQDLSFPRGTVCPDGRLDLCKQALGPLHCRAVAEAIPADGPVKHLLLGMDGLGDDGAEALADMINDRDPLETVFVGCNAIRTDGMAKLAAAVGNSKKVRNLWLKRNPIGATGAGHLANALNLNTHLRTLDLNNTMLGDDGLEELCKGIAGHSSLERMYLGANGITELGAGCLGMVLCESSKVIDLYLDCNRLRDAGVKALLEHSGGGALQTLSLASNGIGAMGISYLTAFCKAPLRLLDIGRAPTALKLGETHNHFGQEGATMIAEWLLTTDGGHQTIGTVILAEKMPGELNQELQRLCMANKAKRSQMPGDVASIQSVYRVPLSRAPPVNHGAYSVPQAQQPTARSILLNDGHEIPQLALGVYRTARGPETLAATLCALRAGYRHIDTAELYGNEADVGAALQQFLCESGLPRSAIWITTKFTPNPRAERDPREALAESLKRLQLDYVDLYLIHKPNDKVRRLEQWASLVSLQQMGLARSIGVSNYGVHHLQELLDDSSCVPAVNQVELSPFTQRQELVAFCAKHNILCAAHSPLTRGKKLGDSRLVALAAKRSMTPAQVLVKWALQKGWVAIPKSARPDRIVHNAAALNFELQLEDLQEVDEWDEHFLSFGWDAAAMP
mmetsp:Transcript_43059/g.99056  ORF Transcript_43059/g.99056 Transcript_43059/m.99056 type:complete len:1007 (-) Transcript_43059:102-3122(-)